MGCGGAGAALLLCPQPPRGEAGGFSLWLTLDSHHPTLDQAVPSVSWCKRPRETASTHGSAILSAGSHGTPQEPLDVGTPAPLLQRRNRFREGKGLGQGPLLGQAEGQSVRVRRSRLGSFTWALPSAWNSLPPACLEPNLNATSTKKSALTTPGGPSFPSPSLSFSAFAHLFFSTKEGTLDCLAYSF